MLYALCSAKGSPGVTTAALALTFGWPGPALLAECDPAGSDITAGYLQAAADPGRGLYELVLANRRGRIADQLWEQTVPLPVPRGPRRGEEPMPRWLLAGARDPGRAAVVAPVWEQIAASLSRLDEAVLADCGRLAAEHAPMPVLTRSEVIVLVVRPTLPAVAVARTMVSSLRAALPRTATGEQRLVVLVTGAGPYPAAEVASALELDLLARLPVDTAAAEMLSSGAAPRGSGRSPLLRAARSAATKLSALGVSLPAAQQQPGGAQR